MDSRIDPMFATPVYRTRRESGVDSSEKKEIEDIIEEGMHPNNSNSFSKDSYIFNTRLYNIKEFCEQQIAKYVKETINPSEELDFYITQSWINVTKPGEHHFRHSHPNSIISGVFYITTVEEDRLYFFDPYFRWKHMFQIKAKDPTPFNSDTWVQHVKSRDLILFPSWLDHSVFKNKHATKNRISLSFNTFVKGTIGDGRLKKIVLK